MVNDPKFRTIARVSRQEISRVISVYVHMMTCASNATERGHTEGWCDEDVATALDIETEDVQAIREAMQGRVLDGDYLTGWEKRQPLREREDDTAAERKRHQRAREANQNNVTPSHATSHQEKPREEEIREEEIKPKSKTEATQRASRLPADWLANDVEIEFCKTERPDLDPIAMQAKFRDYWTGVPGKQGLKLDWSATWRNFIRSERAHAKQAAGAWWATDATSLAKGAELGLRPGLGESMQTFKGRIQIALDNAGRPPAARASPPATVMAAEPKRVEVPVPPELKAKRSEELKAAMRPKTP
jgi:hypothetical protein